MSGLQQYIRRVLGGVRIVEVMMYIIMTFLGILSYSSSLNMKFEVPVRVLHGVMCLSFFGAALWLSNLVG